MLISSFRYIFQIIFPFKRKSNFRKNKTLHNHQKRIESSQKRIETLIEVGKQGGLPAQLNYLRKVDAFVFEEMILTAIENKAHVVIRNNKYTGDGGIDGAFEINGERFFVQAKRYSGYIRASDVYVFATLCKQYGVKGIFVHTGKTGSESRAGAGNQIEIISGNKLISLLLPRTK